LNHYYNYIKNEIRYFLKLHNKEKLKHLKKRFKDNFIHFRKFLLKNESIHLRKYYEDKMICFYYFVQEYFRYFYGTFIAGFYIFMHCVARSEIKKLMFSPDFLVQESMNLYMLNAVFYSVAALLLTGVILIAPILSLSLHQFQDSIYLLCKDAKEDIKKLNYYRYLLYYLRDIYKKANKYYFPIWFSSIVFLFLELSVAVCYILNKQVLFFEGIFFIIIGIFICAAFSLHEYGIFNKIRPGERKINLFLSQISNTNSSFEEERTNSIKEMIKEIHKSQKYRNKVRKKEIIKRKSSQWSVFNGKRSMSTIKIIFLIIILIFVELVYLHLFYGSLEKADIQEKVAPILIRIYTGLN